MSKKIEAKQSMLKELSKKHKDSSFKNIGDGLKAKQKVVVAAPDKEGLEKGLSMAQKLLKARFGEIKDEEESEEEYEDCAECKGEGCAHCEESEEEESDEE